MVGQRAECLDRLEHPAGTAPAAPHRLRLRGTNKQVFLRLRVDHAFENEDRGIQQWNAADNLRASAEDRKDHQRRQQRLLQRPDQVEELLAEGTADTVPEGKV